MGTAFGQKNDTIRLFNGDRVVGEIKDLELGLLRVKTDHMGELFIEWDQVASFRSTKQWDLRTRSGMHLIGYVVPSPLMDHQYILSGQDSIHIARLNIVQFTRVQKGLWARMDGSISLGFSYQQANNLVQITAGASVSYTYRKGSIHLSGNSISSEQKDVSDNIKQDLSFSWDRNLRGRWVAGVGVGAERNTELGLDLRQKGNIYGGNLLIQTTHTNDLLSGGVQQNREDNQAGISTDNTEVFLNNRLRIRTYKFPKTDITIDLYGYYGLTIADRFRAQADIKLRYEVVKDLFLGLEFYDQYDSRPLDGGPALNDYRISTTASYTF
ncbi:MAG: DUF481 domain-containing protein [Flavobacteriales bacterium]|nr:DUF481 domain-containing protein [Flavobacteriales bacterium]